MTRCWGKIQGISLVKVEGDKEMNPLSVLRLIEDGSKHHHLVDEDNCIQLVIRHTFDEGRKFVQLCHQNDEESKESFAIVRLTGI